MASFFKSLGKAPFDVINGMLEGIGETFDTLLGEPPKKKKKKEKTNEVNEQDPQ